MDTAHRQPAPKRVRIYRLASMLMGIVALAIIFYFFDAFRIVFLGLLAAAALASALMPIARHILGPRWLRAIVAGLVPIALAAGLVALLSWLLSEPVRQAISDWPAMLQSLNQVLNRWSARLGIDTGVSVQSLGQGIARYLVGPGGRDLAANITGAVSGLLVALAFIFFGAIYFLGSTRRQLLDPWLPMLPLHRRRQVEGVVEDIQPRLRGWLIGTLISMAGTGIAAGIGFTLLGLDMALPLALIAGVSEIVPTIGPALAFLLAVLFASTQGTNMMLGVAGLYLIIQLLESYVLLPYVMRRAVKLPPLVTLFSIVFWGQIFGLPGVLLAIPIDLLLWTIAEHFLLPARSQPERPERPEPAPARPGPSQQQIIE